MVQPYQSIAIPFGTERLQCLATQWQRNLVCQPFQHNAKYSLHYAYATRGKNLLNPEPRTTSLLGFQINGPQCDTELVLNTRKDYCALCRDQVVPNGIKISSFVFTISCSQTWLRRMNGQPRTPYLYLPVCLGCNRHKKLSRI